MENFKQLLNNVKAFMFDVDGVLTDGSLILMPDGNQVRTMNIKDGYALQLAVKEGYIIGIISGSHSDAVIKRLNGLGITEVFMNVENKVDTFNSLLSKYNLKPGNAIFMGDDLPDLEVMKHAGIATCPKDAATEIKDISIYVSQQKGGKGCVRDVIEQVLRLHGKWK